MLTIPGVETVHPVEAWLDPCYPMTGPKQVASAIYQPVAHYTAAENLPDGDLGEFIEDLPGYLRAMNRSYWNRNPSNPTPIVVCGRNLTGYSVGYLFAVDWLGGAWELRGFRFKSAANAGHNDYTFPILFLVDGNDPVTDLAAATARAIWREARRRSGRADFKLRPLGHGELRETTGIGTPTPCPGVGILGQMHDGYLDLDYQEAPPMATLRKPVRVLDTRDAGRTKLEANKPRRVGILPEPPEWAGAVMLNLVATQPAAAGWLSIDGGATSKVNFAAGWTIANGISVPLQRDGDGWFIEVTSNVAVHIVVDVSGFDSILE